jgi:transcriptional antiterminator RfaH
LAWSVAQTQPNAARIACVNLQRQGFSFYNPLIKEKKICKKGFCGWRTVQLFSNYLFVEIIDQWRAVKSTRGILNLLMSEDEKPAVIEDSYITSLRARENKDGLIILGQSKFKNGNAVQIKAGPFAHAVGIFDGMGSRDRVYILLSMLGTKRRIEMSEGNLVAV